MSIIFKGTDMFVTLKNLANLENSPVNHIFPSFYMNSATQATPSTYTIKRHLICTECKGFHKVSVIPTEVFSKVIFKTKENTEQNVLAKKYSTPCLQVILITYRHTLLA